MPSSRLSARRQGTPGASVSLPERVGQPGFPDLETGCQVGPPQVALSHAGAARSDEELLHFRVDLALVGPHSFSRFLLVVVKAGLRPSVAGDGGAALGLRITRGVGLAAAVGRPGRDRALQ